MNRLKKILYFTIGEIIFPFLGGVFNAVIFGNGAFEYFYKYFLLVYIVCYFLFAALYRGKVAAKFPNRYIFYGILYLPFEILGVWLYLS